ncbi:MAG: biopolymer transporter ExbD [Oceanicaulis sp.]|jgi:biopolymer transport protein ExbD|uniref:ExbD/TolR family protein n=2 Tax=Oceanicaulis TaxID=153232 RepID=UPI0003B71332|nr:biopolymer transporter ExbD [Oceanicaulis alexandrii]MAP48147.1 biopolymer transporter ExbD [Oceanicaulis sp.]MBL4537226.1 biopolymer transporter ExbD [Oceanicaulis sp.]VXC65466.1 Biopolymer transporter ExbD [Oceanicaulis sp. 350]
MRRKVKRGSDNADVDMTPMLDIVFILLIFFIVTATFLQEQGIDMRPPPPSDNQDTEPNPVILVQVNDRNQVFVNQDPTSELRVLAAVSRIRAEQPDSAVLIEVADEARHGTIVLIWDEMKANSIPVSITRAEGGEG